MTSGQVAIARCGDYSEASVRAALHDVLGLLGGLESIVRPGQRVFLKPNVLLRAEPERAVTTHPEVLRATIRAFLAAGATVSVGDSPGGPASPALVDRTFEATGIARVCAEEGADLVPLDRETVDVPSPDGRLYKSFRIGKAVVNADLLVTMPKFKTHGLMMFTGAVKNLFGCVPGLEKMQYHLRLPGRREFGEMLVDLAAACPPGLAIMDAVVGMEGEGPSRGTPRAIGCLMASLDSVALDVVASAIAGLDPMEVYTNAAARDRGLGPADADDVEVLGVPWREIAPSAFALPDRDASRSIPPALRSVLLTRTVARPFLEFAQKCTRCGTCEESCPVRAIDIGTVGPDFDLDTCIRCYCCHELCPTGAIGLKTPFLARLAGARRR